MVPVSGGARRDARRRLALGQDRRATLALRGAHVRGGAALALGTLASNSVPLSVVFLSIVAAGALAYLSRVLGRSRPPS